MGIPPSAALPARQPTYIEILQAALSGGITPDTVAVVTQVKDLLREEQAHQAKLAFGRSFFALRKDMPIIYADKEVHTKDGTLAFQYCSPQEIKDTLEPLMQKYGFCTMTGQELVDGKVTVTITLMHQDGHSESRSFTARVSPGNALTNPTQCDAAASSAAERHCLIKLFGLRTRINADADARNEGAPITDEQAEELHRRITDTESDHKAFLKFCGVPVEGQATIADYKRIMSSRYPIADEMLRKKEARAR